MQLVDSAPAGAPRGSVIRALVVDDVPEICEFYRAIFSRIRGLDIQLVIQTDPNAAIKDLRERRYDLVVSDFRMKHADGVDVLNAARDTYPDGRRVLMTGYNEVPTSIARIREARIDAYLRKPLKAHDLLLILTDLLLGDHSRLATYRAEAREMEEIAVREEELARADGTLDQGSEVQA